MATRAAQAKTDPRTKPFYSAAEAASYLHIPANKVRRWAGDASLIRLADPDTRELSFLNLAEVFVLNYLRTELEVPLPAIRRFIQVMRQAGDERPLLNPQLQADWRAPLLQDGDTLVSPVEGGQQVSIDLLKQLPSLRWDAELGLPQALCPTLDGREVAEIDPRIRFGQPVIPGTRIRVETIAERVASGQSFAELAERFDQPRATLEAAVQWLRPDVAA